jgi:hypothetical protein
MIFGVDYYTHVTDFLRFLKSSPVLAFDAMTPATVTPFDDAEPRYTRIVVGAVAYDMFFVPAGERLGPRGRFAETRIVDAKQARDRWRDAQRLAADVLGQFLASAQAFRRDDYDDAHQDAINALGKLAQLETLPLTLEPVKRHLARIVELQGDYYAASPSGIPGEDIIPEIGTAIQRLVDQLSGSPFMLKLRKASDDLELAQLELEAGARRPAVKYVESAARSLGTAIVLAYDDQVRASAKMLWHAAQHLSSEVKFGAHAKILSQHLVALDDLRDGVLELLRETVDDWLHAYGFFRGEEEFAGFPEGTGYAASTSEDLIWRKNLEGGWSAQVYPASARVGERYMFVKNPNDGVTMPLGAWLALAWFFQRRRVPDYLTADVVGPDRWQGVDGGAFKVFTQHQPHLGDLLAAEIDMDRSRSVAGWHAISTRKPQASDIDLPGAGRFHLGWSPVLTHEGFTVYEPA